MDQHPTVAIVDDHSLFRKGLEGLVNDFPGVRVLFTATNGKDFIRQIGEHGLPDIVLMDISMPEMDGYETTLYLKENHPEVKVLALSSLESETAIIRMIRSGARGYVLKDVEPGDLRVAFEETLSLGFFYNDIVTKKIIRNINSAVDDTGELTTFAKLSKREIQFLRLVCSEKTYSQIAKELFVSERTVDGYREALFKKLELGSRVGLAMYAIKNNLVRL